MEQLDTSRPHVLLVHGAWHGAWAWEMVERELSAHGWRVQTVELPSTADRGSPRAGLHDDAHVVRQAVEAIGRPNVQSLVYVCAFQLDIGETLLNAGGGEPPPWWVIDGETITADNPRDRLYNDVSIEQADWAIAKLRPFSWVAVTEPLTAAAWHTVPSTYIICDRDQAFTEGQQYFAARERGTPAAIGALASSLRTRSAGRLDHRSRLCNRQALTRGLSRTDEFVSHV